MITPALSASRDKYRETDKGCPVGTVRPRVARARVMLVELAEAEAVAEPIPLTA
ncbi:MULTISPECIES: hypothetical protein [Streptomyces]|uniref:hypothetical protein n=1 Tax=Streptomyces TaxID=1883 RepID=UPI002E176E0F